jgi:primosomal protein N' (replication factor Y) (superfamily II helicase)
VRVRTDVPALSRLFDYAVPESWTDDIVVGTRVRVALHGRRVGGWVVDDDVTPPEGVDPLPLKGWSGWGPPAPVVELAEWAAWRWAGPVPFFLGVASPLRPVRRLPAVPAGAGGAGAGAAGAGAGAAAGADTGPLATAFDDMVARAVGAGAVGEGASTVLRIPPTTDLIDLVLSVVRSPVIGARPGGVLVLVPSVGWAERLCGRLVRRGYRATTDWAAARAGWPIVVGSRAAAWAPLPEVSAALVLDAHDEAYKEESAPTYSAVDVVTERARRAGSPCIVTSPCPSTVVRAGRAELALPVAAERAGWSAVERVDRRGADPRTGMFSEEFVRLARAVLDDPDGVAGRGPLVCFYDRTGRARLLACAACGELARCTTCGAAVAQHGTGLRCPRCASERPLVCAACGKLRMKTVRVGVSRLREELAALLGTEVGEVSGPAAGRSAARAARADVGAGAGAGSPSDGPSGADGIPATPVLVGTEAVLHRVRRAAAVVFLDIDLHLLAPRFSATDETLALLVRASRMVGPRHAGPAWARLLVQTRVPDHPVLEAVARGDLSEVAEGEEAMRRSARLPPFSALASLSGPLAAGYADALRQAGVGTGVTLSELPDGGYLAQAPDHGALGDLLAAVPRPGGRGLRVAVDPAAI